MLKAMIITALVLLLSSSCRTSDATDLKNNGAEDVENRFPQALRIDVKGSVCTVQLIEPDTIVSAAHCFANLSLAYKDVPNDPGKNQDYHAEYSPELKFSLEGSLYFNDSKFAEVTQVTLNPLYQKKIREVYEEAYRMQGMHGPGRFGFKDPKIEEFWTFIDKELGSVSDIAIAKVKILAPQTRLDVPVVKLSKVPSYVGQEVHVVGYGAQDLGGPVDRKRRWGVNSIASVTDKFLALKPEYKDRNDNPTVIYQGDSGGMLYDARTGEGLGIAVITSPDWIRDDKGRYVKLVSTVSKYLNIHGAETKAFICKNAPLACAPLATSKP